MAKGNLRRPHACLQVASRLSVYFGLWFQRARVHMEGQTISNLQMLGLQTSAATLLEHWGLSQDSHAWPLPTEPHARPNAVPKTFQPGFPHLCRVPSQALSLSSSTPDSHSLCLQLILTGVAPSAAIVLGANSVGTCDILDSQPSFSH